TFSVTKIFADGNDEAEITVSIDCNTGLILDQDKLLSNGESVEFVVTSFTPGAMSCTITEDGQAGYDGEYNNISLGEINDESCVYETIAGTAAFSCEITNTASPVDIVINKEWVIEGSLSASGIDQGFGLDLYCESAGMTGPGAHNDGGNSWHGYDNGEGDETFIWQIVPLFPSSSCYVEEYSLDSYVEVDNPCGNLVASVGNGVECTITNTVFFEGIPTLSQYGMAILALLMLGVGFVSFRRFS
ncbi:MAG TPA: IPTL-CTERM sorting domain-containing protein, partial [Xanthomonadales bacterium]|nr:IPTL-CTERM sorting domain-containing protein [Xanthomonadales bacterium]